MVVGEKRVVDPDGGELWMIGIWVHGSNEDGL